MLYCITKECKQFWPQHNGTASKMAAMPFSSRRKRREPQTKAMAFSYGILFPFYVCDIEVNKHNIPTCMSSRNKSDRYYPAHV